ncbi:hypothetical protein ES705_35976 [subsurface metagenome]
MAKIGLRVPPGFALSVEAYKDFMSMTGVVDEIGEYLAKSKPKDLKQCKQASVDIRQIVQSKAIGAFLSSRLGANLYNMLARRYWRS